MNDPESETSGSRRPYEMRARQESVDQTRDAIMEAMIGLWLERHYDDVTLSDVADRAGVSRQTVHRHFGTKDDLVVEAAKWQAPRIQAQLRTDPGDVAGAVAHLVDMYEQMGDANVRALALEGRVAAMDTLLDRGRAAHQAWIEHVFAPFLPGSETSRRHAVLTLYAATDVMVWKLLRRDFGLARSLAEHIIGRLVEGALAGLGVPDADPLRGKDRQDIP